MVQPSQLRALPRQQRCDLVVLAQARAVGCADAWAGDGGVVVNTVGAAARRAGENVFGDGVEEARAVEGDEPREAREHLEPVDLETERKSDSVARVNIYEFDIRRWKWNP